MLAAVIAVLTLVAVPAMLVGILLLLVGRRERAREQRITRQIRVTEAIDAELGAIVAPVVERRLLGGWRIAVAVPLADASTTGRVAALAHAAMQAIDGRGSRMQIVLTEQSPDVQRANATFHAAAATLRSRARERGAVAWTGTTTSPVTW